jgi:raffinose/stachyose/melibiose transport system permease protein
MGAVTSPPRPKRQSTYSRQRSSIWRPIDGVSYVWFALVAAWALLQAVPIVVIFYSSLRESNAIIGKPFGFGHFDSDNYPLAWHGPEGAYGAGTFIMNSATITIAAVLVGVAFGALSAYGISNSANTSWAKTAYILYILAIAMPYEIIVIPLYVLLNQIHLLNSDAGAALAYGALVIPTVAVLMKGFYDSFPRDLIEAARIDGAGELRIFVTIVLPLVKGGLLATAIIGIVYVWGDVELALIILTSPDKVPISVGMLGFAQQYAANYGALFAGLAMAVLPILVVYLVFQRYVTRTLTLGAVTSK